MIFSSCLTRSRALFATVFILVLLLYTATLAPGVVGGDAGEHQFAAPLLGIPHATGYPLYILAGKLWTLLLPVGGMAWRMNFFSAVGGAFAAATTALVVARLVHNPQSTASPLVAGLTLAFGFTLWQWSTIAGVRSWNVFFFALLTLEATIWREQKQRGDEPAANRTLRWLAFTVGLSLAHHRTTIFYLPLLVAWVGWYDRRLMVQPKRLIPLVLLAAAPLLLYLFIYWRGVNNPPYSHETITDWRSFWFLVGASDSSGLFLSFDPAFLPARLAFVGRDLLAQLSWPGVTLAAWGGFILLRRQTAHFLFHGLLVLLLLMFTLDFEVVNLNEAPTWYLMPAYFIFAVWLGVGAEWLTGRISDWANRGREVGVGVGAESWRKKILSNSNSLLQLLTLGVLAYTLAWPNWVRLSMLSEGPLDEWRQVLRGTQAQRLVESSLPAVEPHSLILGDWEQYTPFVYYQLVEGLRPDVTVRLPLDRWQAQAATAQAAGHPVYLARKPPDLLGRPYLSMVGPLVFLGAEPQGDAPPGIIPLGADFEGELELIGYRAETIPQAGPILQLTLYWRVPKKSAWDYALSLRLLDGVGQELYRRDATHPVLSSYPTTLWTPGEVVGDFYELPLPPEDGPLTLHLLPYRTEGPGQWHNLTLTGTEPPQEGVRLEGW
jgi:hypothetical protein